MKTIDLGEKMETMATSKPSKKPNKYYPTVSFSDNGVGGVSSFDDQDIGKIISIKADIKLVSIESEERSDTKKKFLYRFEVRKINMPDDLSQQEEYKNIRQKAKNI